MEITEAILEVADHADGITPFCHVFDTWATCIAHCGRGLPRGHELGRPGSLGANSTHGLTKTVAREPE